MYLPSFTRIDKTPFRLTSGQAYPSKKHIFGHVTSLIGRNVSAAYSKIFPGLLHTPAKFEKNPPNGHRVIRKTKRGAGGTGFPPIYKQVNFIS